MFDLILSLVMLAAFALVAGGIYLLTKGVKKQGALMLVLAAVLVANALIWVVPTESGDSPLDMAAAADED